uniref:Uncharacterized protein n=1 Tax=Tanacetum cinerariifolium TaxID=118510 RepID=A0A6L2M2P4_TANCI|nr:hypothetical protein [Tanacetum cinerariifolium]
MEEYIRLEEEKARPHGKVYNWETAKYDFKDFENEFPAIVYNDALTSKSDFLTEPTLSPQYINELDFKDETSSFEYDEVEQNVEGYTEKIVHDFEDRLVTIFRRRVNRVYVLDFEGLTPEMRQDLAERLRMGLFESRSLLYIHQRPVAEAVPQVVLIQHFWEGQAPEKVTSTDLFYLRISDDGLRGLSVVTRELPLIDMGELVKLKICIEAVPTPVHAPPPPPPPAGRTMPQRLGRLEEVIQGLHQDVESLCRLVKRSMTEQDGLSTWMISCMMQLMEASRRT